MFSVLEFKNIKTGNMTTPASEESKVDDTKADIKDASNTIVLILGEFNSLQPKDVKLFFDASKIGKINVRIKKQGNNDIDKVFMIKSVKYVENVKLFDLNSIEKEIKEVNPNIIYDSDKILSDNIKKYCLDNNINIKYKNINYIKNDKDIKSIDLTPNKNLTPLTKVNSLNNLTLEQKNTMFPWRLCLLGGWLDQPFVSKIYPGSVIVVNVKYNKNFSYRCGLATSSREYAIKIWNGLQNNCKHLDNINLAKLLFGAENPPGSKHISGSQDHLGLMLPGISKLDYNGGYWPYNIKQILNKKKIFKWLEDVLYIVPGKPRANDYNPMKINNINKKNIKMLSESAIKGWKAILECNTKLLGQALRENNKAWKDMLPVTVPDSCGWKNIDKKTFGALVTHGGGYIMCVSNKPVKNGFKIEINDEQYCPNSKELNPL